METTIHNVVAISVSDTVHENEDSKDGGFSVRKIKVTTVDNDGVKSTFKLSAFSSGLTPAKLSI